MAPPRVLYHESGALELAQIGCICVAIWRQDSTLIRVGHQRDALAQVVAAHPGKTAFLCVVEPTSAPPEENARKESSRMIEEHGSKLLACAVVIEGTGFRAAIVRSVASGIAFVARSKSKTPVSYFGTVMAGAECLREHVDIGNLDKFVSDVELVRSNLNKK